MKSLIQKGLVGFWCFLGFSSFAQLPKMAIVPTVPSLRQAADILTTAFSAVDNVVVIERVEIERVLREQILSVQNRHAVQIGQVLNADGLLLLELVSEGGRQVLRLRLTAVKTGVALWQRDYAWPLDGGADWQTLAVRQAGPVLSKLLVPPKGAVGLSILGFRSTTRTPEAQAMERDLTRLLRDRLMLQPDVFVLERRNLQLLFEENSRFSSEDEQFRSGSYLLDGIIDKEGYSPFQIRIDVRLIPPHGQPPTDLQVTGSRTNPAALTEELVQTVLKALGRTPAAVSWDPVTEAAQYYDEAKWAFRWGMMREAQSASEAAWALGLQTAEVAELRIKSWRETGADHAGYSVNSLNSVVSYASWPDAGQFADLLRAAQAYEEAWRRFVAPGPNLRPEWVKLGTSLVNDLTGSVRHYYFAPEACEGEGDQLALARKYAERFCALALQHPDCEKADTNRLFLAAKARGAAFWADSPEKGVAMYREMLKSGIWPQIRARFINRSLFQSESGVHSLAMSGESTEGFSLANPPLVGWTWSGRRNWRRVWDGFIAEACASTDARIGLEGRYLKCSSAWSYSDFESALLDLIDFSWEHRTAIAGSGLEYGLLRDIKSIAGPDSLRLKAASKDRAARINKEVWSPYEQRMKSWIVELEQRSAREAVMRQTDKEFEEARAHLATLKPYDFKLFYSWQRAPWNETQAAELCRLLEKYACLTNTLSGKELSMLRFRIWSLDRRLKAIINAPKSASPPTTASVGASANQMSSSQKNNSRPPDHSVVRLPSSPYSAETNISPAHIAAPCMVENIRFWAPEITGVPLNRIRSVRLREPLFREGRLWVEVEIVLVESPIRGPHFICAINPQTLEADYAPIDPDALGYVFPDQGQLFPRTFEVYNGCIYRVTLTHIDRFSFSDRKWVHLPLSIAPPGRLSVVYDELYLTTADSILSLRADGTARVLASCRRRPPQTELDEVEGYGGPALCKGKGQSIRVVIGDKVWELPPEGRDWTFLAQTPQGYSTLSIVEEGAMFTMRHPEIKICRLLSDQTKPELLLTQALPKQSHAFSSPSPYQANARPTPAPLWQPPYGMSLEEVYACLDGSNLWLFAGSIVGHSDGGRPTLKAEGGRQGLLLRSPLPGGAWSLAALKLDLSDCPLTRQILPWLIGAGRFGYTQLLATPGSFILMRSQVPGFWIIPRSEISQAFAKQERAAVTNSSHAGAGTARLGRSGEEN